MPQSEQTRGEIVEAAERFLWHRPFRELTVAELMSPLSVGRSAFYFHFTDRYDVAGELLRIIEAEALQASEALRAHGPDAQRLRPMLQGIVGMWVTRGPVLRAISEASSHDQELEALYRWGFIERMVDRITAVVDSARCTADDPIEAREIGVVLAFMVERYLCDGLGRHPQADPDQLCRTLIHVFESVLHGDSPALDR